MFCNAGKIVFDLLEKSCLTYGRVETIFKKAPRNRRLDWLGVNLDLSKLQKNVFQRNQFTDYMT